MKSKFKITALLPLIVSITPAMALTWNDGGPTNIWSTAAGDANWTGGVTWTNSSPADFTGAGEIISLNTAGMTAGAVAFGGAGYSINTNGNSMTWGALAGTAGFTKSGTGTLTINGAGGASGAINLTGGQITVGGASALGTTSVAADGASTVLAANGHNIANSVTLSNGAKLLTTNGSTVSSVITLGTGGGNLSGGTGNYGIYTGKVTGGTAGTTSLTVNSGHTQLNNTANDFAGNILINGNYYLKTIASESIPDTAVITIGSGGGWKLQPAAGGTFTETIAGLSGTGYQVWAEGTGVNATFRIGFGDVSSTFDDTLTQISATLAIEKIGSGTFTMNGSNSYTGTTTVTAGTLAVGNGSAISNSGSVVIANTAGAVFKLNGSETIGSLAGGGGAGGQVDLQANTLTVGTAADTSFDGIIGGTGGALTKAGAGTLTLSAVNTYTGATNVNVGTLSLTGSLHADSSVSVGASGTLSGSGTVNGTLTSTGTIAPGVSATPATLTVNNDITLNGGTLKFDVSGATCDKIEMDGLHAVTTNAPVVIQLSGVTGIGDYTLIDGASGTIDTSNFTATANGLFAVVLDNATSGKLIAHVVSGVNLVWNGSSGNASWDVGSSTNWLNGAAATAFADSNHISFTNAAAEKNITLDSVVSPGSVLINNTDPYSITGSGNITGATGIIKQGSGSLNLGTFNSYSGVTSIEAGTLVLSDWEALGSTAGNTIVASGATLDLNGQTPVSEPIVLNGSGVAALGALINGNNVNPASLTGAVSLSTASGIGGSGDLTLSGLVSGSNALTKIGGGRLALSGTNTYTGGTVVSSGVLLGGPSTSTVAGPLGAANIAAANVAVQSGATLDINGAAVSGSEGFRYGVTIAGNGTAGQGALINNGANSSIGVVSTPNIALSADAAIGGSGDLCMISPGYAANALSLNGHTLTKTGTNTFYLGTTTVGSGAIFIAQGTVSQNANAGANDASNAAISLADSLSASLALSTKNLAIGSLTGGGSTGGSVSLGASTLTIGADNSSPAAFAGAITGTGSIVKSGTGTLSLAGANTYTGNTTVNTGTLELAANGQLKFAIGATSANSIAGAGTVVLNGDFVIDTTAAAALTTGSWTLEDVPSLSGAYGATFTVAGFTDAGSDKWTKSEGTQLWTFDETTGVLTLSLGNNYASWAATHAGDGAPGQDFDNDGVANGVEYFMGNTGSSFTASPAIVNNVITWPKNPAANATFVVETSTNLMAEVTPGDGGWAPATSGVVDNGTSVQYTVPNGDPKRFTRIRVIIP